MIVQRLEIGNNMCMVTHGFLESNSLNFHFIELCIKESKTIDSDAIGAWEEKVMGMTEIQCL